jgi:hypothetical protein
MIAIGDSVPSSVRGTPLDVDPSGVESRGRTQPGTSGTEIGVVTAVAAPAAPDLLAQILALDPGTGVAA